MAKHKSDTSFLRQLTIEPLTRENWGKFVQLFGDRGACGNCWCMYYRLTKTMFNEGKVEEGNKRAIKDIVWAGRPAGLLGMIEGQAVAWCAFAPREDFIKLKSSRVHKPIDDKLVWSIPCFFIEKNFRRLGVSTELLRQVIIHAKNTGIKILEAYPAIPTKEKLPDSFLWIGLYRSFERAGFKIVDNSSKNRPMVRFYIDQSSE